MRLTYRDPRERWRIELAWHVHARGAELRVYGRGFSAGGFGLGVYGRDELQEVLQQMRTVDPYDRPRGAVRRTYTFTRPVTYARGQGPGTRLAIHGEVWPELELGSPALYILPLRYLCTVAVHEQGERTPWRWLGRYDWRTACGFLEDALENIGQG